MSITSTEPNPVDAVLDLLQSRPADLTVDDTETKTIEGTETENVGEVQNQGVIANQGILASQGDAWTVDPPDVIERVEQRAPQERQNTSGAALYIWQPTDGDLERVSADGDLLNRVSQVEIFIYVLEDQSRAVKLQEDLIRFLGSFMDDNRDRTDLNSIEPNVLSDERTTNLPRDTGHHVTGIEVECIQKISVA